MAGKELLILKTTERNGSVVGIAAVSDECGAMIITSAGKVIRINAGDVSVIGRNTQGVRLINLDPEENVVAIAHIAESDSEEGE